MLNGKQLIAGDWVTGEGSFSSTPISGPVHEFSSATSQHVDQACAAAEGAFWSYGATTRETRAQFLNRIADEIDVLGDEITEVGTQETGLPEARLIGERGRTVGQLRLFADLILQDDYLDKRHDEALPDRAPLPRPDMKMVQRPIGPVAIFGASNFPLAFSTAGGDTAAAFAAGCPVVVRGHPAHPGTGELVAQAISKAVKALDLAHGVFSFLQGTAHQIGADLVTHHSIKAVGFTGSLRGGRALFDLCAARDEPIPFFGELGSINPMFLLPAAVRSRGQAIAEGWAASLTMGAGQFCTNPGVAVVLGGEATDRLVDATASALARVSPQPMLTDAIAEAYRAGQNRVRASRSEDVFSSSENKARYAAPSLHRVSAGDWLANTDLAEEVFGPLGIVVITDSIEQMMEVANTLKGQLTCTLHLENEDQRIAARLLPVLERKAGRILANGFPTGVEVSGAMIHGGPYPASTNFGATSVGTLSIRRFLRPVCYQNFPLDLLPSDWSRD